MKLTFKKHNYDTKVLLGIRTRFSKWFGSYKTPVTLWVFHLDGCCDYWTDIKAIIATQNTALLNSLIDEEVQLYKIFDDDIKMCVGIKLMADKVREKYDE